MIVLSTYREYEVYGVGMVWCIYQIIQFCNFIYNQFGYFILVVFEFRYVALHMVLCNTSHFTLGLLRLHV